MNWQNVTQCIEESHNIGSTVFHNICTGNTYEVPWGTQDWLGWVGNGFVVVLACLIAMVIAAALAVPPRRV